MGVRSWNQLCAHKTFHPQVRRARVDVMATHRHHRVVHHDFMRFRELGTLYLRVKRGIDFVNQRIDSRIAKVASIRPYRRLLLGIHMPNERAKRVLQ